MTQALYAHMNNKRKNKQKRINITGGNHRGDEYESDLIRLYHHTQP
jgi:hypothetical protein